MKELLHIIYRNGFAILCGAAILALGLILFFSPERSDGRIDLSKLKPSKPDSTATSTYQERAAARGGRGSPDPGAPSTRPALSVFSYPRGATVYINGDSVGVTPLGVHRVQKGIHDVAVRKEGYTAIDTTVRFWSHNASKSFSFPLIRPSDTQEASSADRPSRTGADSEKRSTRRSPSEREAERASSPETRSQDRDGTLHLIAAPSGALVTVSGEQVGRAPQTIDVAPGRHEVTFRRDGYENYSTKVRVQPQAQDTVQARLHKMKGPLAVTVEPWGNIYIDGTVRTREADTRRVINLPVGRHMVRVEHPALGTWRQVVEVKAGADDTQSLNVDMNAEGSKVGHLAVTVEPWGNIYIDGTLRAKEVDTQRVVNLPAGEHVLRVEHPALGTWKRTVEIRAGGGRSIHVKMDVGSLDS